MRYLRVILGLAVSAAFLALLFARVDRAELAEALRAVRPVWLLAAVGALAASLWLRAARWAAILRPIHPLATADAASLLVIGYAANNLLPARAGEVVRSLLFQRRHHGSAMTALGTIVVERVFDGLVLALFLAGALTAVEGSEALRGLAWLATIGFIALTLGLGALAAWPNPLRTLVERVVGMAPGGLRGRLQQMTARLLDGLGGVRGVRMWSTVLALTAASWALEASCYALVARAFDLHLGWWGALGVCGAANLAIAAPSTSGGIGPYEFFAREVAIAFGASAGTATAYALVLHAVVLVPVVIAGLALLWREQAGLAMLTRRQFVAAEETP